MSEQKKNSQIWEDGYDSWFLIALAIEGFLLGFFFGMVV